MMISNTWKGDVSTLDEIGEGKIIPDGTSTVRKKITGISISAATSDARGKSPSAMMHATGSHPSGSWLLGTISSFLYHRSKGGSGNMRWGKEKEVCEDEEKSTKRSVGSSRSPNLERPVPVLDLNEDASAEGKEEGEVERGDDADDGGSTAEGAPTSTAVLTIAATNTTSERETIHLVKSGL